MPNAVTPELDALVRACFATPKANLPRLVLADYLDEQGENDRATILRIQCERPPPKKGKRPTIRRGTGTDLREAVARVKERFAPLRTILGPLKFARGFLAVSVYGWYTVARNPQLPLLQELFAEGWVESVRFSTMYHSADGATLALLRQAGTFEVARDDIPLGILTALAAECRPGLPNVRLQKLKLPPASRKQFEQLLGTAKEKPPANPRQGYESLTPATARMVAESGALDGVRHLALGGDPGEDGFRQIVEHPALRELHTVCLQHLKLPPAALRSLWAVPNADLRALSVVGVPVGDDGVRELCAGSFRPREVLRLREANLTGAAVPALTGCAALEGLTFLDLHGNALDTAGTVAVVRSPTFGRVVQMSVGPNLTDPELLPAMFAAPPRPEFIISSEQYHFRIVRPAGAAELTVSGLGYGNARHEWPDLPPCPEPLAALTLGRLPFDAASVSRFAAWLGGRPVPSLLLAYEAIRASDWPRWLALIATAQPRELVLRSLDLGPRACQQLAASAALATVRKLSLEFNRIGISGALAVANSPHRGNLKELRVNGCGLSRTELARVQAAAPGVTVTTTATA